MQAQKSRLPLPHDTSDSDIFLKLAEEVAAKDHTIHNLDLEVLQKLAHTAAGQIGPMSALIGGITGQEVLKAVSGKFHPLHQWLYFDALECLPEGNLSPEEVAPLVRFFKARKMKTGRDAAIVLMCLITGQSI